LETTTSATKSALSAKKWYGWPRPAPYRRIGIAGALIDDSADRARSHGARSLEVVIAPNGNNVAHLFDYYARRNFTDEGRRLLARSLTHGHTPRPTPG
jgi:hypothetical protein